MNAGDCLRVLQLPADATPDQIRQTYLDLVRVWHPDRFQSNSRLQQLAQERLCEINEAYSELKNHRPEASSQTASQPATDQAGAHEAPQWNETSWTGPRHSPRFGGPVRATIIAVLCAAPFLAAFQLIRLLRVPALDADLLAARAIKPGILTPMRVIDPSSDVRLAADMMTEWARGDAIDLWRPNPSTSKWTSQNPGATTHDAPSQQVAGVRETQAKRTATGARDIAPRATPRLRSGTELIATGRSSAAGELRLINHTNLEAIATVVTNRTAMRAVYITPHESAIIGSIRIGVYELHVELGTDLDIEHLSFRKNRSFLKPLGPFEFLEITSENGIIGKHYEIALNPR
jgi:hypothetical protein